MSQQVWLGLAGDLVSPDDVVDYYFTKLGGYPVLPGTDAPVEVLSGCRCSVCGRQLSLVLQAYAPHPDAQERVVLVLGCTKLGCGKQAGCWRAIRCQLPPEPREQQQHAAAEPALGQKGKAAEAAAAAPTPAVGFDAFAAADDDWGDVGDWGASAASTDAAGAAAAAGAPAKDAFDFSDLTMSLEAADQQPGAAAAAGVKQKSKQLAAFDSAIAPSSTPVVCCRGSAGALLPEFYIYAEPEPGEAATKVISSKELDHVQQLLAAYEAEAAAAAGESSSSSGAAQTGSTTGSSSSSTSRPQAAAAAAAAGGEGEEGSWAGEGYEKDELRGVERGYLKFSKRLARQPQQCARYSLHGPLLWPKAQQPQPSRCAHCGGPRVFELQLMPALIHLTIEAAQMALDQGMRVDAAVVDAVANWDWASVAVFTCQASCSQHCTPAGVCEAVIEEVALINEQDCHIALPPPVPAVAAAAGPQGTGAAAAAAAGTDDDGSGDADQEIDDQEDQQKN